jgi:hypothetical protein
MMNEEKLDRKSIKEIVSDLVKHINDERPILPTDKEKYNYDRGKWISHHGYFDTMGMEDFKKKKKNNDYTICLETLRILIYQIHFFNHIIHTNDEGRDVYNNNLINEKTLENEI